MAPRGGLSVYIWRRVSLRFIRPCSPVTVPAGDAWLHEPKLDGYRLQIIKDGRQVRLYSRRGNEWTGRLLGLAEALAGLPCRSAVLDAELCLPAPNFYGLPSAMRRRRHDETRGIRLRF